MKHTARTLYQIFADASAEAGCSEPEWDELDDTARAGWQAVADEVEHAT
jgi:hypothetical protein